MLKIGIIADRLEEPWGGSEELWSQAAIDLVRRGFGVAASVGERTAQHPRVQRLKDCGVEVHARPERYSRWRSVRRKVLGKGMSQEAEDVDNFLSTVCPALVVVSSGWCLPPLELVERCASRSFPLVTLNHVNCDGWWVGDEAANRYRRALSAAQRCFFVSVGNLRLVEKQIGCDLPNAEVVRNPFNVSFTASVPWLPLEEGSELRLACVGRLHPGSKGQDLLLEALGTAVWMERRWHLTLYGDGPMKNIMERLVQRFNLDQRVTLAGFVSPVENIWAENHVLVMPSRFEGLPLAAVEAMLCGRPVIATNVAGNSEVIQDGVTGFLADAPTVSSVASALERAWDRRLELQKMGAVAAESIRTNVPPNPASVFAQKIGAVLKAQCNSGVGGLTTAL
jgi:glycosyltransferase involved in cell wall biosynthesis